MYAYHNLVHSPCVYPRPIDSPPGRCLDWVLGHLSFWGFPRLAFQGKSFGRKPCRQGRASSTCPDSAYLHSRVTCPSLIHRIPSVLLSHPVHGKDLKFRYKKIIGSKMNTQNIQLVKCRKQKKLNHQVKITKEKMPRTKKLPNWRHAVGLNPTDGQMREFDIIFAQIRIIYNYLCPAIQQILLSVHPQ